MKGAGIALVIALTASNALAQAPRPEKLESCAEAMLFAYESYDLGDGIARGNGGSADWIHCASSRVITTLGGGAYSIAGNRWAFGKFGASLQARNDLWFYGDANVGSGRSPEGSFDYLTVHDGVTVKPLDRVFAKLEHQYVRIAGDHGNVVKAAVVVQPLPPLLVELGGAWSAGGNLGTRSATARLDWVESGWRGFVGYSHGRIVPQVVDIATGTRLPDTTTREWFGGATVVFACGELSLAFDELRTDKRTRRRTLSLGWRWIFA
jgi:hypothetical protein